jgi:hypothetical protein
MRQLLILVIRIGFKPMTHSLEGCCSIQLSYRTEFIFKNYISPTRQLRRLLLPACLTAR